MRVSPATIKRARAVRLIAMDIDGVLTAGEIIVLHSGEEVKIWNVRDRFAFHLVHRSRADIRFAWITGRKSRQVAERAKEIGIEFLFQDCMRKREALEKIMARLKIAPEEVAYLGDDLVDIPVLRSAGFAVCPSDAPEEVRQEADYVTTVPGGRGVLREVVEIVLKSRGLWKEAARGYIEHGKAGHKDSAL